MSKETAKELLEFIRKSPASFQAAEEMRRVFKEHGFTELFEEEKWKLKKGGNYFVMRNHSAFIAFSIPEKEADKFHIMASHSDSPSFKVKENPEMKVEGAYIKLNVEKYGGMLMSSWLDRPLSVAGRVMVLEDGEITEKLVSVDRDILLIPNLAVHMNREANDGYAYNAQKDMLPLYSCSEGDFMKMLAKEAGVSKEDILSHDLFLYHRTEGSVWGEKGEFVSAPRLDDLQCAF